MAIGFKIQELLTEQKRNVRWLERETGISHNTLYSIIRRDNASVDTKLLSLIAHALNTTEEYLTGMSDTKENITLTQLGCIQHLLNNTDYQLIMSTDSVHLQKTDITSSILIENTYINELHNTLENICLTAIENYYKQH
ncbi:MAG: hypothetical protein IJD40_07540 [Lachnospiraceae bacterium]|nr:hypothetical protein [Lachnospiraceae bacterium]